MSDTWSETIDQVVRLVTRPLSGPAFMANSVWIATLALAECLLTLSSQGLISTLVQLREEGFRRMRAGTEAEEARAAKLTAEAVEAEERRTLLLRNDRISRAEEKRIRADAAKIESEAAKTKAEAEAILAASQAQMIEGRAAALSRLVEAIRVVSDKGGEIAIDVEGLKGLLESTSQVRIQGNPK